MLNMAVGGWSGSCAVAWTGLGSGVCWHGVGYRQGVVHGQERCAVGGRSRRHEIGSVDEGRAWNGTRLGWSGNDCVHDGTTEQEQRHGEGGVHGVAWSSVVL